MLVSFGMGAAVVATEMARQIRRDQLEAVRRSVMAALPVNALLGLAGMAVAIDAGQTWAGAAWFAASSCVNLVRAALCRAPCTGLDHAAPGDSSVERHLVGACLAALASGFVWAWVPVLCAGYTSEQTLFYLIVTCGITAGAVTHGIAYARIPAAFITLPLLSAIGCLVQAGGFDRLCLAATVLLYLVALLCSAFQSERVFREASQLKNEATALARSREAARAAASALAGEMTRRATHDDLTGLLNRAGFIEAAGAHCEAAACSLLLLDLDGFKSVNDAYGHEAGDRVLSEVARRLCAVLPEGALLARLGGDEFAVLHRRDDSTVGYPALAAGLIAAVAQPLAGFDAGRLGVSIGIHQGVGESLAERMSCADGALYAAKAAGRNRFHLFDEGLRERFRIRRDSERDLPQALAAGSLEVWFQPIYRPDARTLAGLEALVRWRHPVHGWISPPDVIAAGTTAGLTEPLLCFILDRVCAMMLTLRGRGLADVRVAMNVSPREMAQMPIDEIVLGRLAALHLPASGLEIEITEETALDIGIVHRKLAALSRAGVRIALDDFGTGYSSLSSLRQLKADRVKIDRSLVTGLDGAEDKRGLVAAVLGIGRSLGLEVVAEGVETREDVAALQALGDPFMQGYHLGRPIPAVAVEETLLAPWPAAA